MDILSAAGLGATLVQWLLSIKDRNAKATIDDYLEWLRRRDHQELVEKIEANRADVAEQIDSLLDNIGWAIAHLDESQQRRHAELIALLKAELALDLPNLKITQLVVPKLDSEGGGTIRFRFDFQVVNESKSHADITGGTAILRDGSDTLHARIETMSLPGGELALKPDRGSGRFRVLTDRLPLKGRGGREPEFVELVLDVRQFEKPLRFIQSDESSF